MPHVEVNVIIVNQVIVDFTYQLQDGDSVLIFPESEGPDVSPVLKLKSKPLAEARFVLDVHLGRPGQEAADAGI